MKTLPIVASILRSLALLAAPLASGLGQDLSQSADPSDVRIVSSWVDPGEPVPETCRSEAHVFAGNLVRYPLPRAWHWVLVCDEAGWRRFLRLSGRGEREPIYASTDLAAHTTYIRGFKLLYPYDLHADPGEVLSHELAHIRLNSAEEASAERLARLWQRGAQGNPGASRQAP